MNAERESGPGRPTTGYAYLDAVLDQPGSVLAMAHRGGSLHPDITGAENTLHAFRHAISLGYHYLETDVHTTRDGELVLMHDDVLDRVSDRTGRLAELSAAEVSRARIGGEYPIPTMAQTLEEFPDCRFNIDLKSEAAVVALADLIARMGVEDRVLVGSFSGASMDRFRAITAGRVATSATPLEAAAFVAMPLGRLAVALTRGRVAALQVPATRGPLKVITRSFVRRAHRAGVHVHAWTIDEKEEMDVLLDTGVDGLFTDRTDVLKDVLVERGQWRDHA